MWSLKNIFQVLCSHFLLVHQVYCFSSFTSNFSSTKLCPHYQRLALLQFKNTFSINSSASSHCEAGITSYPKTVSWNDGTNCCSWDGVTCDSLTGHVIGLNLSCSWLYGTFPSNSSLFLLRHLQSLNLDFNHFNYSRMPSEFGSFASLMHLSLYGSRFSGRVPSEISHLSKLVSLKLSSYDLRIEKHSWKSLVENLTEVRVFSLDAINLSLVAPASLINLSSSLISLSLSNCKLAGKFPDKIFHLPNLQWLNLYGNEGLTGYFPKSNWSGPLEFLDLSLTLFHGELPYSIGNLASLMHLILPGCNLTGSIPGSIGNLTHIVHLNLSHNSFSGPIPSSLVNLEQLIFLDLGANNFTGQIPNVFGNFSKLAILSLGWNKLEGQLPSSMFNLPQLQVLCVGGNQLSGSFPSHIGRLSNLYSLDLSYNLLNGTIPSWLYTLPSLQYLHLGDNQLTGHINEFQFKSLEFVNLSNNKLGGPFASSFFEHVNLEVLVLSSNNFSGIVELDMFSNLKNLFHLDLSYNNLSLRSNVNVNYTLPNLMFLFLSSCNMNGFPNFLKALKNLKMIDLSNDKIHGQFPKWMWDVGKDSLYNLNLSHNSLTSIEKLPWKNLQYVDLRSNLLQGSLPIPPPTTKFFSISNNYLTGEISSSICNASSLEILNLSHNNMSGIVPRCLGNFSNRLLVLDLRMNNFHGTIPSTFAKGNSISTLNFNGNQLEGLLPRSLVNCRKLEVLNLGNNRINDTFPYWLGTLPELQVLILRSNRFHGVVLGSKVDWSFPKLRIFDISNNKFVGRLPTRYIKNLKAMINVNEAKSGLLYMEVNSNLLCQNSVIVTMKGLEFELVKILFQFTTIDLSNNNFQGEIPEVIGKLRQLKGLNFSHNRLTGDIPPSMGNLTSLEWLDLSSNKLVGEIPRQLTDLTSLSFLNLTQNQLVGPIPQGKQFNTFGNDSYEGNLGLCGFPLSETCSNDRPQWPPQATFQQEDDSESENGFGWKVVLMGYGCGMVFGMAIGYLVFRIEKPKWVVRMVEGEGHKKVARKKKTPRTTAGRRDHPI